MNYHFGINMALRVALQQIPCDKIWYSRDVSIIQGRKHACIYICIYICISHTILKIYIKWDELGENDVRIRYFSNL